MPASHCPRLRPARAAVRTGAHHRARRSHRRHLRLRRRGALAHDGARLWPRRLPALPRVGVLPSLPGRVRAGNAGRPLKGSRLAAVGGVRDALYLSRAYARAAAATDATPLPHNPPGQPTVIACRDIPTSCACASDACQAAQDYLSAAVQRNRIDDELRHVKRVEVTQRCMLGASSAYESLVVSIEKERAAKAGRAVSKGGALDFSPAWCAASRPIASRRTRLPPDAPRSRLPPNVCCTGTSLLFCARGARRTSDTPFSPSTPIDPQSHRLTPRLAACAQERHLRRQAR